jgi:cytochrome c
MRWLLAVWISFASLPAAAEMRGHGGPVRAIAISPDGKTAVTGSFDTTVIVWDLETETARQVLRFHEGPVNVVRMLGDTVFVTAGDDGRVIGVTTNQTANAGPFPHLELLRQASPVVDIPGYGSQGQRFASVLFADGTRIEHGSRHAPPHPDRSAALGRKPLAGALSRDDHVASFDDGSLRWLDGNRSIRLPANALTLAAAPDHDIVAGGADGRVYLLTSDGSIRLAIEVQELPVTSLAISVDGRLVAAAGLRGAVTILDRATGKTVSTLVGPGLPVWSLAFHPDGKTIYTGGADRMVRKWDIASGQPSQPANAPRGDFTANAMNERGAQVFRACEVCHTVTPDGGNRAGPTLHGVFGRRIGQAKDYVYSPGFSQHGIVWNAETIARLFREGPAVVTPGTKMPEQRVTDEEDLKALVQWLEKVTR